MQQDRRRSGKGVAIEPDKSQAAATGPWYRASMAKTRTCQLCGATVNQNVAAHSCPHGRPCRYQVGGDGMPTDWCSPECGDCPQPRRALRLATGVSLTDKAWQELDVKPSRSQ